MCTSQFKDLAKLKAGSDVTWEPLLKKIISIVDLPSRLSSPRPATVASPASASPPASPLPSCPMEHHLRSGSYFPLDPITSPLTSNYLTDENCHCFKQGRQVDVQSAGLLVLMCAEHGRLIGFELMNFKEGPMPELFLNCS